MLHFLRNVVNTLSASSVSRKSPKYYKRVTALARQSLSECLLVKAVTLFILINYNTKNLKILSLFYEKIT